VKVLTIHVSQFFRNPPTFEKLRSDVLPHLFERCREGGTALRLWSVGCAAGEEPYSLAITLRTCFADAMETVPVSIVATDVDADVLERARDGVYGEDRLAGVDPLLRARYFEERNGRFFLCDEIRRMVTFRKGDLFHVDEYPSCDLILCRNVLIYFERSQQERIIKGFARALPLGGILVLGKSETLVGESRRLFRTICPVERIYGRMQ
jgi:chemotaxis protein methyltransferase CheR